MQSCPVCIPGGHLAPEVSKLLFFGFSWDSTVFSFEQRFFCYGF